MSLVLDASMAISWLFEAERTPSALTVLSRVADQGALVPSLWRLEVANVLRNAVRRGRCDEAFVDRSLVRLTGLGIVVDAETDDRAWGDTRLHAREQGLSLYDAAYLELAVRTGRPLATCDADLTAAARRLGLDVAPA